MTAGSSALPDGCDPTCQAPGASRSSRADRKSSLRSAALQAAMHQDGLIWLQGQLGWPTDGGVCTRVHNAFLQAAMHGKGAALAVTGLQGHLAGLCSLTLACAAPTCRQLNRVYNTFEVHGSVPGVCAGCRAGSTVGQ